MMMMDLCALCDAQLRLLSLENLRDANTVYEAYVAKCKDAKRSVDLPLLNFLRFLLLTLEVGNAMHRSGACAVVFLYTVCSMWLFCVHDSVMRFLFSKCFKNDMPPRSLVMDP